MTVTMPDAERNGSPTPPSTPVRRTGRMSSLRAVISGGFAGVLGVVPHVLHHVTFLAGTAMVAGSGGTALFGALGLLVSVPLLLRLRHRFGTWRAPVIGLGVFAGMFALSAFVIGPAISGTADRGSPTAPTVNHQDHH